ncbi:MAG: carboxypeptidase-like regulatory domain-containing protein [Bacteroidales bacterium]|nr:carboxypeptidase-like regulatory domain-containing protein [Bacteroidales bacterium]
MIKRAIFLIILIQPFLLTAQEKITISGFVTDAATGEPLINATIINQQKHTGVLANVYGYYSIKSDCINDLFIECRFVGYASQTVNVKTMMDTVINFRLEKGLQIDEITVTTGYRVGYLDRAETGILQMDPSMVSKLPSLMGENDLARAIQLMPGVQSGKEGTGGLIVRGGSNDQNLILLDGMTIYNANHIGGFISIFNPVSINYIKLHKGGFPAKFGGRLSSILDVRMKNGNMQNFEGDISIGTLTSKLSYEGPLKKDKSSFIFAARRTVFDLLVSAYNYLNTDRESDGGFNLWDLNAKYNLKINDQTRLYFSFYKGEDQLFRSSRSDGASDGATYISKSNYSNSWGNTMASFRLNHVFSGKVFSNFTLGVTNYKYKIDNKISVDEKGGNNESQRSIRLTSLTDILFIADFEYFVSREHSFCFGLNAPVHQFEPSNNSTLWEENGVELKDSVWGANNATVPEIALYFSDNYRVSKKLMIDIGLRATSYLIPGKPKLFLEPRLSGNYKLSLASSLKFSYTRMTQFVHLISTSDQAMPNDYWLPSTLNIPPETSGQITLGYFHNFRDKNNYEFSVDLFYKNFENMVELKSGTSFIGGASDWADKVETGGQGLAYGAEFLFEKKTGKTTGWVSYTLSKNSRRFDGINDGNWFPFRYDRRHELSIVVNHKFNDRINLSANWIFMSGEACTLPQYKYLVNTQQFSSEDNVFGTYGEVYYYGERNSFRMPAYHRLDFSFNFVKNLDKGVRTWSVGLYNAYNQYNPYYLYVAKNSTGEPKLFSFTYFPIMPSVSYSYKF